MNPALVFFELLLLLHEFTRNLVAVIKIHGLMSYTIRSRPKIIFEKNEGEIENEGKKEMGETKALSNGKESSPSQVHTHAHTHAYGMLMPICPFELCVVLNTGKYFGKCTLTHSNTILQKLLTYKLYNAHSFSSSHRCVCVRGRLGVSVCLRILFGFCFIQTSFAFKMHSKSKWNRNRNQFKHASII